MRSLPNLPFLFYCYCSFLGCLIPSSLLPLLFTTASLSTNMATSASATTSPVPAFGYGADGGDFGLYALETTLSSESVFEVGRFISPFLQQCKLLQESADHRIVGVKLGTNVQRHILRRDGHLHQVLTDAGYGAHSLIIVLHEQDGNPDKGENRWKQMRCTSLKPPGSESTVHNSPNGFSSVTACSTQLYCRAKGYPPLTPQPSTPFF